VETSASPASVDQKPAVGLIGLGAMGLPAAGYLARAGHPTRCYDLDPDVLAKAVAAGAVAAASVAECAAGVDVLLIMVPTDADVLDVCLGQAGALAAARPGTAVLVCSSVAPSTCREVAAAAEPLGLDVLDAALTGGVRAAEAGEVNLLVGGDERVLERIAPALRAWTAGVHHLGPLGSGQIGKTVNNLCHWSQVAAIVEAMKLGRSLGVEPDKLRTAVLAGPAASRTLAELELMRLTWYEKDLATALRLASDAGRPLPMATTARVAMEHISVAEIAALWTRAAPAGDFRWNTEET
jgi:3-hydroxyisobutyrate dehydrogenase-like beta-hydroxyacid dehydrogenase